MAVEVHRDRLSPMVRASMDAAHRMIVASAPKGSARRFAYAAAMFRAAVGEMMSIQPSAEGYAVVIKLLHETAERYAHFERVLPSKGEH